MLPTTERALKYLNPYSPLPEIGSSNNIDEEEEPSAESTEEDADAPSTRQSRRQARQQARQASREIEENTGTAEADTDEAEEESSEEVTNSSETDTSTDETDPTDDSNDGAESEGIFDVDTIFTSGTFEIEGGGGDPEKSIFQGEVELAKMKITKDDDTWSPEFWQASGSLGLDTNGLNLTGTVDAAYYRAGTQVPDGLLSTYSGNQETDLYIKAVESNLETTETSEIDTEGEDTPESRQSKKRKRSKQRRRNKRNASFKSLREDEAGVDNSETTDSDVSSDITQYFATDVIYSSGKFETEEGAIFDGLIELNEISLSKDIETESWSPAFWNATGSLGIDIEGLDITGDVTASYYRKG